MARHTISLTAAQETRALAALRPHYANDVLSSELVDTYLIQALRKFVVAEEVRTKEVEARATVKAEVF